MHLDERILLCACFCFVTSPIGLDRLVKKLKQAHATVTRLVYLVMSFSSTKPTNCPMHSPGTSHSNWASVNMNQASKIVTDTMKDKMPLIFSNVSLALCCYVE